MDIIKNLVTAVILLIIAFGLVPFILMLLWNFVMPTIFGLPAIEFWQAFALYFIFSILFGGIFRVSNSN